ncbi:MAG: M4 family metallopeptidase [Gammaproteobacteria bacterium]|nr:M4 family metallopeptidase [Gammaproteobacteria bacterium]
MRKLYEVRCAACCSFALLIRGARIRNASRLLVVGASLAMVASSLQAQAQTISYAATTQPEDAGDLIRVDAMIAEKALTGELQRVPSPRVDRIGRVHEYFIQNHDGVPVYGAGFSRQRDNGQTVSVFGRVHQGIDLETFPGLPAAAALARLEEVAGAGPATDALPTLGILPTPLGEFVLTWSAPMRDRRTHFIDAHSGDPVHRMDHIYAEGAVGFGAGITGEPQKVSTWHTEGSYQSWDRLRPAELVTLDGGNDLLNAFLLALPGPAWLDAVGEDDDNEWSNPAVVAGHANLGLTYDYLFERHGWRGMDGEDGRVFSIVAAGDFLNAFFLSAPFGPQRTGVIAFGTAPDDIPFVSLDVVGHELMHGVTFSSLVARTGLPFLGTHTFILGPSSFTVEGEVVRCGDTYTFEDPAGDDDVTAPLLCFDENGMPTRSGTGRLALFWDEGGAINEAYSDIIGASVEFAFHPPGDGLLRADYANGEDAGVSGRRMDAPRSVRIGPLGYPEARGQEFRFVVALVGERSIVYTGYGMRGNTPFRTSGYGYSGVHWNSTILSHAFYLAVEGGEHVPSGQTIQGVGGANRAQVEQAFFRAMVDLVPPVTTFEIMGVAIRQAAADLHGAGSAAFSSIHQALTAVGL